MTFLNIYHRSTRFEEPERGWRWLMDMRNAEINIYLSCDQVCVITIWPVSSIALLQPAVCVFTQLLRTKCLCSAENYCDFRRIICFWKNKKCRKFSQTCGKEKNAGFPAQLRDGWHLWCCYKYMTYFQLTVVDGVHLREAETERNDQQQWLPVVVTTLTFSGWTRPALPSSRTDSLCLLIQPIVRRNFPFPQSLRRLVSSLLLFFFLAFASVAAITST